MNKKISLFLIIVMVLSMITITSAETSGKKLGIVLDIIDGEAMVIKFGDSNMYMKLIGVDTKASEEALQYMNTHAKGKYVWVVTEDIYTVNVTDSKFYYAYVYLYDTGEMLNDTLIKQGLAQLSTNIGFATKYEELNNSQTYAKSKKIGIWQENKPKSSYSYSGSGVNINTATLSQLDNLTGITSTLASNIISYRSENPFDTVKEIKFVNGMTKEIYDEIYDEITVVTNINAATEEELLTLAGITQSDIDSIIKYRDKNKSFNYLEQFYKETDLSSTDYENNKNFIALDYRESIDYRSSKAVNINTATSSQIKSAAGTLITSSEADAIVNNRARGYTYKTLMELAKISTISQESLNKAENNLKLYTDINNADTNELESLFGNNYSSSEVSRIKSNRPFNNVSEIKDIIGSTKYDDIKNVIYIDKYDEPKRANVNLATQSQLEKLSISSGEARQLSTKRRDIDYASDLPFNVNEINNSISLYTNINTATESELETLYDMPSSVINAILDYREQQPFGSMDEVEGFFADEKEKSLYRDIENFITVR